MIKKATENNQVKTSFSKAWKLYALNERLVLHTTEKELPSIQNLKVKKYQY